MKTLTHKPFACSAIGRLSREIARRQTIRQRIPSVDALLASTRRERQRWVA